MERTLPLSPAHLHEALRVAMVWACALALIGAGRFLPF